MFGPASLARRRLRRRRRHALRAIRFGLRLSLGLPVLHLLHQEVGILAQLDNTLPPIFELLLLEIELRLLCLSIERLRRPLFQLPDMPDETLVKADLHVVAPRRRDVLFLVGLSPLRCQRRSGRRRDVRSGCGSRGPRGQRRSRRLARGFPGSRWSRRALERPSLHGWHGLQRYGHLLERLDVSKRPSSWLRLWSPIAALQSLGYLPFGCFVRARRSCGRLLGACVLLLGPGRLGLRRRRGLRPGRCWGAFKEKLLRFRRKQEAGFPFPGLQPPNCEIQGHLPAMEHGLANLGDDDSQP
mmetsp:Transcript_24164/g.56025  ORF Transcript_24164/g.56025 Transcript_24164/m.56025 type:complete len:299 (-) Transcript_24164:416-1312(-)